VHRLQSMRPSVPILRVALLPVRWHMCVLRQRRMQLSADLKLTHDPRAGAAPSPRGVDHAPHQRPQVLHAERLLEALVGYLVEELLRTRFRDAARHENDPLRHAG
jgi:hypothetical protein